MKSIFRFLGIIVAVAVIGFSMSGCFLFSEDEPPRPTVTGITVSPATVSVARGGMQNFTATVLGTNNPPQSVEWAVSGWGGTHINSSGGLVVASSETNATLTITATSTLNRNQQGTATVTVPQPTVTGVTVNPASATIVRGRYQDFTATVAGVNNHPTTVTWTVVGGSAWGTSISTAGRLTVATNETASQLTVRATSTFNTWPQISGEATVTVQQPQW